MVHEFQYRAPHTRPELLSMLIEYGETARLLAGGTDLLPNMRMGVFRPLFVLDSKKLPDADRVTWSLTDGLSIGHGVTINGLMRERVVRERFPLLAEAAHQLASHQIRNRATVVGNVVNASPCADMAPPLLCLDARAVIVSNEGERTVPFADFFTGPKRTVLRPGEFLAEIRIPAASSGARGGYRKLKRIKGHDLGIVGVMMARLGDEIRASVSSAAPTPVLVTGISPTAAADEVAARVRDAVSPIDDVRCTAEYRRYMIGVFVHRLFPEVK